MCHFFRAIGIPASFDERFHVLSSVDVACSQLPRNISLAILKNVPIPRYASKTHLCIEAPLKQYFAEHMHTIRYRRVSDYQRTSYPPGRPAGWLSGLPSHTPLPPRPLHPLPSCNPIPHVQHTTHDSDIPPSTP